MARMEQDQPPERGSLRQPSFGWRVLIMAVLFAGLGVLAGLMAGLFLGEPVLCVIVAVTIGAVGGALFEAWPLGRSPDRETRESDEKH